MRIKVLPLEQWMRSPRWWGGMNLVEFSPIFNRNGWYCVGGDCWFELDGHAYIYERQTFIWVLIEYSSRPLRASEAHAFETLVKNKLLPSKNALRYNEHLRYRDHQRATRLHYQVRLRFRDRRPLRA